MPSTDIFHMPTRCIHVYTHKEFMIWSQIQVYKGNVNIYGPLWTPTCICAIWTYFLTILYIFPLLFVSQKTLSSPSSLTIVWQTFSIITASYMSSPPYILLFITQSPVICKDFFPLVYMYELSRYYTIPHQFGSYFPLVNNSLSLEIGPTAAFKLLAFIASDFLVLLLSPLIIIHILFIITQDTHLIMSKAYGSQCHSMLNVPATRGRIQ